ncbi:MAG TPA: threonine/serine dehydratase [Gemmatimonadales bacterium]|nr:threonine/serine dehydratase [Gemmatimonadales bacterium]
MVSPVTLTDLRTEITRAEARIRPWILETPLQASSLGPHLKLEQLQHTRSFKARGAFNKLLALAPDTRARGVIAASTGNHGAAVSYAAAKLGVRARIVVAEGADPAKLAAIRAFGGELETHGDDSARAESFARRQAERENLVYVSPYNDPEVIAGQGTIGIELVRQLPHAAAVFIALGGGGLLAGVAAWLKTSWPGVAVIGCSPENSAVMIESVRAGRILELESKPTLSDGTAGGIEPGAITFELCRSLADEYLTVTEAEILAAMQLLERTHELRVEGAAGVALAGYLRQAERWRGKPVVVILCGGNVKQ